jgi:ApeA N-terminal domain 1
MTDYTTTDKVEFSGEWFLPAEHGAVAKKIHGNFTWADRMGHLQLFNSLNSQRSTSAARSAAQPVIHGETVNSKQITMLDAFTSSTSTTMGEAGYKTRESFKSNQCLIGAHVDEKTTYSLIYYRIPGLQLWLGNKGASSEFTDQPTQVMNYAFESLVKERFETKDQGLAIELRIGRSFPSISGAKVTIESHGALKIVPDSPQSLNWFYREAGKIVSLLSFFAGAPMSPDLIKVLMPDGRELSVLVALNAKTICTYTYGHEFFLLRDSVGNDFSSILEKWRGLYEKLDAPMHLALAVFSSTGLWGHVEFLSLMQALEGLHRALMPGNYMPDSEYSKVADLLMDAIPTSVESDHREALKGRIRYGSEYSLRKRLKALVDPLPLPIRKLILGGPIVPNRWVDTRNYFTHWDEAGKVQALSSAEMHYAGVRMRLLLRVLYLHQIGVSEQVLVTALSSMNGESQYLMQLNSQT